MNIIRRLFLVLATVALFFAVMATAWAHIGVATIGNRNTIKSWLNESGFYDSVVDVALEVANQEQAQEGDSKIPVNNPQVQAVAKDALSPSFLQENVEKFLDGTYGWLEGKTPKPEFVIDLGTAKQKLADGLSDYAVSRVASLPACTSEQMASMGGDFDVLSAECIPPGTDAQAAAANLKNEILTNEEFLGDTTFSGDDFKVQENGQEVNIGDSQFRRAQNAYQLASYGPYIFGLLSLLLAAVVFFLSSTKRRGLRRLGIVFIIAGVLLTLTFAGFQLSSDWLSRNARNLGGETTTGQELAGGLVRVVNEDISSLLMWYGLGFLAVGIGSVIFASVYRRRGKDLKQPTDPTPPTDDSPKIIDRTKGDKPSGIEKKSNAETKKPKPPTKIQL